MKTVVFKKMSNSGKKNLFLIPFLFTFANALCGFLSVIKTLDGEYAIAALCILAAACMDLCDGRLARMFNSVSLLGMELDSLCDAISFCFAPAILLYSWALSELGIPGLIVLGLFLCSGLFRLARFNITAANQHHGFIGLPTTLAAFLIANIILYHDWLLASRFALMLKPERIAFLVTIISLLMISSIKFPSAKKVSFHLATKLLFIISLFIILIALAKGFPIFLFATVGYIVTVFSLGIFKEIFRLFHARKVR